MAAPPPLTAMISTLLRAVETADLPDDPASSAVGIGSTDVTPRPAPSGSDVLRTSITIYFPLLLLAWALFELLRRRCAHIYERVNHFSIPLQLFVGGWVPLLYTVADRDIIHRCGLDAWVFLRFVRLCQKISGLAVICSFALFPLYLSGASTDLPVDADDDGVPAPQRALDSYDHLSIANVDMPGRWRLWFAVATSYLVSFAAMILVRIEYRAYMAAKHDVMANLDAQQYSIVVTDLPRRLRQPQPLHAYMDYLFPGTIYRVDVGVECAALEKLLEERHRLQTRLDSAVAQLHARELEASANGSASAGLRPRMFIDRRFFGLLSRGTEVDVIDYYEQQLDRADQAIQAERVAIRKRQTEQLVADKAKQKAQYGTVDNDLFAISAANSKDDLMDDPALIRRTLLTRDSSGESERLLSVSSGRHDEQLKSPRRKLSERLPDLAKLIVESALGVPVGPRPTVMRSAAFVSFTSLRAAQSAQQLLQTENPMKLRIRSAPHLHDIVWENFGLPHRLKTSWRLLSAMLTFVIVCFWTIPTAFVTSLANVQKLRLAYPHWDHLLDGHPLVEVSLEQVAPLLLSVMNALAYVTFRLLSTREGYLSLAEVEASTFTKLCYFQVFQMFFVSAVTGSIISQLFALVDQPKRVLYFLGSSIASQSMLFITFIIVQLGVSLPMRWLRVVPLLIDWLHKLLAPAYAQLPTRQPWLGLSPLNYESDIDPAFALAQQYLILLLVLVFAPIAPIVSYVGLLFFLCAEVVYRRHYFFVNDAKWAVVNSTGAFWPPLYGFILGALVIAQFTLIGLLSLKAATLGQLLLAALLPVCTLLFHWSINTMYGYPRAAQFLPLDRCCDIDQERKASAFEFLDGVYQQPAMSKATALTK